MTNLLDEYPNVDKILDDAAGLSSNPRSMMITEKISRKKVGVHKNKKLGITVRGF